MPGRLRLRLLGRAVHGSPARIHRRDRDPRIRGEPARVQRERSRMRRAPCDDQHPAGPGLPRTPVVHMDATRNGRLLDRPRTPIRHRPRSPPTVPVRQVGHHHERMPDSRCGVVALHRGFGGVPAVALHESRTPRGPRCQPGASHYLGVDRLLGTLPAASRGPGIQDGFRPPQPRAVPPHPPLAVTPAHPARVTQPLSPHRPAMRPTPSHRATEPATGTPSRCHRARNGTSASSRQPIPRACLITGQPPCPNGSRHWVRWPL